MRQTDIITYFNNNYDTNDEMIIGYLNKYIHSSHRICSLKMDGKFICWQPSYPELEVKTYSIYYDNTMCSHHRSGRINLYFTDGTMIDIGLYKFKRFLRRIVR